MGIIRPLYESLLKRVIRLGQYILYRRKHTTIEEVVEASRGGKKGGVRGEHSVWNPAKSDKLERTLESLVGLYKSREIEPVLRPTTLTTDLAKYDGDFRGLYNAAFVRTARPQWAEEIFPGNVEDPSGFQSLVDEINSRLSPYNIEVKNIKQVKVDYVSHSHREIGDILNMSKDVREGFLTAEEAIERLKTEFNINLSEHQKRDYFGTRRVSSDKHDDLEKLIQRIVITKEHLGIDLSDLNLLKGLLFESYAGVLLVDKYGRKSVTPQKKLPLSYRDLSGSHHSSVFIDFLVEGNIFEIKWENDLDNIVNSVLAQVYAFERDSEVEMKPEFTHVICRHTNPQILTHFNENIYLDKEASLMDLDEAARNIQDLFTYTPIEELLSNHPCRAQYLEAMKLMDEIIEEGDQTLIKNYTKSLMQIYMNGEEISQKLSYVIKRMRKRTIFSNVEIFKIFGPKKVFDDEKTDLESRLEIIRKAKRKFYTNFLLDMYNLKYGTNCDAISDEIIADVKTWSSDEFRRYNQTVLENRKENREERLGRKRAKSKSYVDNVVEQQERAYQRARRDNLRKIELFENNITRLIKEFRERYDNDKKRFISLKENQPANAVLIAYDFLVRRGDLKVDFGEYNSQANRIDDCFDEIKKLQDNVIKHALNTLQNYFKTVKKSGLKVPRELGDVISEAEEHLGFIDTKFSEVKDQLSQMDVYQAFIKGSQNLSAPQTNGSRSRRNKTKKKGKKRIVSRAVSKDEYAVIKARSIFIQGWEIKYLSDCYRLLFNLGRNLAEVTQWGATWFLNNSINYIGKRNEEMSDTAAFLSVYQLPFDVQKIKSGILMEGYTLDNIVELLDNMDRKKEYVLKEFQKDSAGLYGEEQGMHLSTIKEWLKVYSKQMREVTIGKITENLRALSEINIWDGGKIHSRAYDITSNFFKQQEFSKEEDATKHLNRYGEVIFRKLEEESIITRRLIVDYYSRKIYNAKVLSYINPKMAIKYLRSNRISPSMSSKPTHKFATYVTDLKQRDGLAFQKYLANLRKAA